MATHDSTPDYGTTVPTEEPRTSPFGRPFYPTNDDADPQANLFADLAGISMAINVLNSILAQSEGFRDQQACGMAAQDGEWPLPPTCVEGVFAAVHYLSRHAESISYRLEETTH